MEVLQFRQWVIGWKELAKILAYPGQTYSTQVAGSSSYQVDHQQLCMFYCGVIFSTEKSVESKSWDFFEARSPKSSELGRSVQGVDDCIFIESCMTDSNRHEAILSESPQFDFDGRPMENFLKP